MNSWGRVLLALAGLMGAAGIVLAALGAHLTGGGLLPIAANFLLFHAAAVAGLAARPSPASAKGVALMTGASLLVLGTTLFSSDLVIHQFTALPPAVGLAPVGGTVTILGWLAIALAAALRDVPRQG